MRNNTIIIVRRISMRYIYFIIAALFVSGLAIAQVSVGLDLNVQSQPIWGPTGYDHVDYYYLPDIEAYYNVPEHKFYYYEGGRWIGMRRLPERFRNYDLYHSYKVVVNEREPYLNHKMYRDQYSTYRGRHDQEVIRDSHDNKYFANKNHPEHNTWVKQQRHDNGKGRGVNQGNKQGNKHDDKGDRQGKGNDKKDGSRGKDKDKN